jgi:surface antigen
VLGVALPHPRCPDRRPLVALAWVVALTLAGLIAPARGLASDTRWAPSSSSLTETARSCPSPAVAAYYTTACWTVAPDRSSPFYLPDGPYAWGQCTYWALEMRPDLWDNRSPADPDPNHWTAYTWPRHARLEGLTVNHAPAPGAVIVWPQSDDSGAGHVAYVQRVGVDPVTGADLVTLQEMNDTTFDDPARGQGDTMTMSMTAGDLAQVQIIQAPPREPRPRQRTAIKSTTNTRVSSGPMTLPAPRLP